MDNGHWTFLTNHAHVLFCVAEDPGARHRDISRRVGITERAVQRIVSELADFGYLEVHKEGRRNSYRIVGDKTLRHPVEAGVTIHDLLRLMDLRPRPKLVAVPPPADVAD